MHRNVYMSIWQSLVELIEGEGDTYFNLNLVVLVNSLRFHSLGLSISTYSPAPIFLVMSLGALT